MSEFALYQHGLITTAQAIDEGLVHANLSSLASRGQLDRVAHGVYRVPLVEETDLDQHQLAVPWMGTPQVCLTHESALAVRGLSDINRGRIHLTVARTRRMANSARW